MPVSPVLIRHRSESYRVSLEESAVPKQSLMLEREKDVFETIFAEKKYRNKILTSQDVEDIRTRLNPQRTKTFFDRMKFRFMAAVGLDKFESEVQDSLELLQKIKENKSLKDIPTIFIMNEQGDTALHLAIKHSNLECVKQLLNKMTLEQINIPDYEGRLPIHLAVFHGQTEIVQILLNKMSCEQLFIKDNQGQMAIDYAMGVRSRHIRAAIQNKAGFDLLSFTMPNQAMQKVLSALLKKEVVMSAEDDSASIVGSFKTVSQADIYQLFERFVLDGVTEKEAFEIQQQFLKDPDLLIPCLLASLGILIPKNWRTDAQVTGPASMRSIAAARLKLSEIGSKRFFLWKHYLYRVLSEEDVRIAGELLRGQVSPQAKTLVKKSSHRWSLEEATRMIKYILTLEDDALNPGP